MWNDGEGVHTQIDKEVMSILNARKKDIGNAWKKEVNASNSVKEKVQQVLKIKSRLMDLEWSVEKRNEKVITKEIAREKKKGMKRPKGEKETNEKQKRKHKDWKMNSEIKALKTRKKVKVWMKEM